MHLVIDTHTGIFPDPIVVGKGEVLQLSGKTDNWDGHQWLWAKASDGREGWIPDDLPNQRKNVTTAAFDYSASELDVEPDDQVVVHSKSHGWAWCTDNAGRQGWLPRKVLKPS